MTNFITHQLIAELTLLGMAFEAIGGLYLAYDLLGGKTGPLRTVTRTGSFVALFFLGYSLVLGIRYAAVAALGMGLLLAVELRLFDMRSGDDGAPRAVMLAFGMLRGLVVGLAAMPFAGVAFGALFSVLAATGIMITYAFGFTPTADYESSEKPSISKHKMAASLSRAIAVAIAGLISAHLALHRQNSWIVGLKLGLAAGLVSALVSLFSPTVEWWIENIPERKLGVLGLELILLGGILQTLQYWVVVFDVTVR